MGIWNPTIGLMTIPTIGKQWEFRLVECAQINPHSENAPDTGGGVTSHIEQVSYLFVAKWKCQTTRKATVKTGSTIHK